MKLFAIAKDLAGTEEITVDVPAAATMGDVRRAVEEEFSVLRRVLPHAMWAIDAAYAHDTSIVNEYSDIALIPPVSGG